MREKTTSVTNLVQQIADERIEHYVQTHRVAPDLTDVANTFLGNIKSSLEQACRKWTSEEQELLKNEVKIAIAQIAKNHERSANAIVCRINDHEDILMEARYND